MDETKKHPIDRFLDWVADVTRKDDRGTLAELRRASDQREGGGDA